MTTPVPIQETGRYQSLDMIHRVALFGILLMNITGFGLPFASGNPTNADLWAWITTNMLREGTQRGMFSIRVFQLIVFGPLEWGWRTLTYMQKQPMRRSIAAPVTTAA